MQPSNSTTRARVFAILLVLGVCIAAGGYLLHRSFREQPHSNISEYDHTALHGPLFGDLYTPSRPHATAPRVIVLNGSEGYHAGGWGPYLAARGFTTLMLCYFQCPGRPDQLKDIDLEYVFRAVTFMRGTDAAKDAKVVLLGGSRGGELALLVGSLDPDVYSVISYYGSPFVGGAYPGPGYAWLLNGQPVERGMYIHVDQIRGPVLLYVGLEDKVWPPYYTEQIAQELKVSHHPYVIHEYSHAGHAFGQPYLASLNLSEYLSDFGGTRQADLAANEDSLRRTIEFLRDIANGVQPSEGS